MSEPARVIVLAGPSGAGKSRLAERLGLPVLRLDDFYKEIGDPSLPMMRLGTDEVVDWDHADSWDCDAAVAALTAACRDGRVETPVYDISTSSRTGHHLLDLHGSAYVVAEGIFAHQVVDRCRAAGILADAVCVRQHALVTFWRRLRRDLAEHRKPWWVLVRRGILLMRVQGLVVDAAVERGCTPCTPDQAWARLTPLLARTPARG